MKRKPAIMVTEHDLSRLEPYIDGSSHFAPEVADALDEELARARVIAGSEAPPTLVTMNSRIVFEDVTTSRKREITLVYPPDADAEQGRVSVLSPVGAALLGLSVGQEIDWELPNGKTTRFRVASIEYQPEAAGHEQL